MKKLLFALMAVSMVTACQKAAQPVSSDAPAEAKKLAASAPTAEQEKKVEEVRSQGAAALTEEKLAAFLVYEREMLPHTRLALGMATAAYQKAGNKMADEMAKDERLKVLGEAQKAALAKAGLTLAEVPPLSLLTGAYYPDRVLVQKSQADLEAVTKRIADAKAQGKQPSFMDAAMEPTLREQISGYQAKLKEFEKQHGAEVVQLLDKHLSEYAEINEQRMKMILP